MSVYDFTARDIDGNEVDLKDYKGKALLIVNTASECGFTPQYEDLQKIYDLYQDKGLEILGFPCNQFMAQEPGVNEDIESFCKLNYGVSFQLFDKIDVNGKDAHPLFKYLKEEKHFKGLDMENPTNKILVPMLKERYPNFSVGNAIRWNFTKFLVDRKGQVVQRYESSVDPMSIEPQVKELIND